MAAQMTTSSAVSDGRAAWPHARGFAAQGWNRFSFITNGLLSLDPASKEASLRDGGSIQLSNREFALLRHY
jgi:DNA-binding response OmpR family regulator